MLIFIDVPKGSIIPYHMGLGRRELQSLGDTNRNPVILNVLTTRSGFTYGTGSLSQERKRSTRQIPLLV